MRTFTHQPMICTIMMGTNKVSFESCAASEMLITPLTVVMPWTVYIVLPQSIPCRKVLIAVIADVVGRRVV